MSKKRVEFPLEVKQGSVIVKIYRVENKGRDSFTVSYHANGKRTQKMYADFDEALAEAKAKALLLSTGELDALHLSAGDARIYVYCNALAKSVGMPLEVLVKDAVEAIKAGGGKASLLQMSHEFGRRHMHICPDKMLPKAVDDMIEMREKDGTGDAYLKLLKVHLKDLKTSFNCQLQTVTSGMLADHLRNLPLSPRSKNNGRATIGAFIKFCKERGWLPRDHEGIELIPKFKEKPTDIEIYTRAELTELLRVARSELVPFLTIGAFAGLRTAEIERLDWAEVHLAERFIEIKAAKAKTASRRLVPISENLAAWLEKRIQEHGRVWPFDNTAKQIGWLMEDLNESRALAALQDAAAKAGRNWTEEALVDAHRARKQRGGQDETDDEDTSSDGRSPSSQRGEHKKRRIQKQTTYLPDGRAVTYQKAFWKKNALRHSYISYRVAETQDVAKVALEAGNSPQIIFQHYRELVQPKQAKEWFAIAPMVKN